MVLSELSLPLARRSTSMAGNQAKIVANLNPNRNQLSGLASRNAEHKVKPIVEQVLKVSSSKRKVKEITLDMADPMKLIAKKCFPQATQVIDRFHVQKLATAAL